MSRCTTCKNSGGDSIGKCSYVSDGCTSKFWPKRNSENLNSYELFSTDMGSVRKGDIKYKVYTKDSEPIMKSKVTVTLRNEDREEEKSEKLHSPEYVKKTAKLFESVKRTGAEPEMRNGVGINGKKETETGSPRTNNSHSADAVDGETNKKPSYLGVSCSNSGYRNVINYDSKLREGFHSAHSQKESLVVCSSRLRENSPLRRDVEFAYRNGKEGDTRRSGIIGYPDAFAVRYERKETKTGTATVNGVNQKETFVNISTSTKTISTFRNSGELENNSASDESKSDGGGTANVNLRQILNGNSCRKGYSNLGFSPRILKSPEKNCNSFLKSISSFESGVGRRSEESHKTRMQSRGERTIWDSTKSIQQRIERLYGPAALAQGFYSPKTKDSKNLEENDARSESRFVENIYRSQPGKIQISLSALTKPAAKAHQSPSNNSNGKSLPIKLVASEEGEIANSKATETSTPASHIPAAELSEESQTGKSSFQEEKNGHYFLKLLKKETDKLEELAGSAERELENGENLPEEINGKLRAAAGKARLLVCQKLHQFEGLCQKNLNENPSEPFPTTSEDLAGFWDMVMLQVEQVYGVFDEIAQLKKNNWKVPAVSGSGASNGQTPPSKPSSRKSTPTSPSKEKTSEKAEAAKKAREETRRKMLEERRKKMKELKENKIVGGSDDDGVEIFAK